MSPNDDAPEETYFDTEEGSVGPAQRRSSTRRLADEEETPPSEEELDARQDAMGERRKQGGPPLDAPVTRTRRGLADEDEDVPPTETEEAPAE